MSAPHKPAHLFNDVLDRLEPSTRQICDEVVASSFATFGELVRSRNKGGVTKQEFDTERAAIGDDMYMRLFACLDGAVFRDEVYCAIHDKMCPVSPRQNSYDCDGDALFWIELAGNTCCPWSRLNNGDRRGLLDEATYPM